jgi:signal transduction histidine kinase/ligand-binding sensor domain-containing protein
MAATLGLALFPGPTRCRASELVTHIGEYTIQNWQVEQGLPQISITSIAQTPDGYLWLGTFNGLVRFDGVRFVVFDEGNTPALGSSRIAQLQTDDQGALWIVTATGGCVRMAAGQFTATPAPPDPLLLGAGEFSNDPNPRVLLSDRTNRWWQIEHGRPVPLDRADRPRSDEEPRFLFENSGVAWLVNQGRPTRITRNEPLNLVAYEGSTSNHTQLTITSAAASQSGGYWLATETGIYRLRQGKEVSKIAPLPAGIEQPMSLREDGQGNLWAGKWGAGVCRLEPDGSWRKFSAGTGLADNLVNCLFRDREGSLWVGTFQGGLYRLRPRVFQMYHVAEEAGNGVVMSVTQDRQGRMWFGVNGGGLNTWSGGKLHPVTEPAVFRSFPLAYSVLADRQDALWVGLYGTLVLHWQNDTVTPYGLQDASKQPMTPHALFEAHNGTIWLGCTHGLISYAGGRLTHYTRRDGLSCDTVVALAEDRLGTLYAGTDGGGLNCLRQGQFTCFTQRDGLADDHVSSLYMDKEEALWIGTANGGLSRFTHGRFANFSAKDGLPSATIGTLIEDDQGNLWLGSNRGIIRVSRQQLNAYADGDRRPVVWEVFGLSHGLTTVGCTGSGQPASWKARDGKLWFATIKGAAVVDPKHVPFNPLPPPVVIEEVVMDDQLQALQSAKPVLTAPPRTHRVEFRFTGLSLVAPEEVRFRYRLEPFDSDWIDAGTRRVAYYTGIPPGDYQFRLTACNNNGVWNETISSLSLVVLPPWWMTWWFRALAMLGAAGLVFGTYERRLHRLRRERLAQESFSRQLIASQENERRRLAGELHDGMGQDLLVIANQAQLSLSREANPPGTAARLKDIAETAKHALQQARRMAHNLRPGLIEELGFTEALQASAEKATQAAGIALTLELANVDGLLPPEFEVNLFRIVQEALNNVIKHARASEVKIELSHKSTGLRLLLEDNGCGFDPGRLEAAAPAQRGLGIRQISERVRMMGAQVTLDSRPGHGTRWTIAVPVKHPASAPALGRDRDQNLVQATIPSAPENKS